MRISDWSSDVCSSDLRMLGGIRGPLTERVIDAFVGPTTRRERPQAVQTIREALTRVDTRSTYCAVNSTVPRRPGQRAMVSQIRTPVLGVAGHIGSTPGREQIVSVRVDPGGRRLINKIKNTKE